MIVRIRRWSLFKGRFSNLNNNNVAICQHFSTVPAAEQGSSAHKSLRSARQEIADFIEKSDAETLRKYTRNFSVIAHVDHGKSTLCDRLLQTCGVLPPDLDRAQFLDTLQVERERGITVKAQTSSLLYTHSGTGEKYLLNLVDTPGHIDFSYEVQRSLSACQGAVLLCDAVQGVQAQTVANFYHAFMQDLTIIGAANKIDVPQAQVPETQESLSKLMECDDPSAILPVSARNGEGVDTLLQKICELVPPPTVSTAKGDLFKALLVDMWYDNVLGVVMLVAVKSGKLKTGDRIKCFHSNRSITIQDLGVIMAAQLSSMSSLSAGQVGYVVANLKDIRALRVGETLYQEKVNHEVEPFPGFEDAKSMVFAGVFPADPADGDELEKAMTKILLTDASVQARRVIGDSLGTGYRCGFLGVLHMEVIQQRLKQEHDIDAILTSPSVPYKITLASGPDTGKRIVCESPDDWPDDRPPKDVQEPLVEASIVVPKDLSVAVQQLCSERRGESIDYSPIEGSDRIMLRYLLPFAEVVRDFFPQLQSVSHGYASFSYEQKGYRDADVVKVGMRVNNQHCGALSFLALRDRAPAQANMFVQRLSKLIDRQQFEISIQATLGVSQKQPKVIAKHTIKAVAKSVIQKDHSLAGDPSRKKKLFDRQKAGKKKLRQFGKVPIPSEAFVEVVRL